MKSISFQINFKRVFYAIQLTTYYLKSSLLKSHSMFVKKDNFKKSINQSKELELLIETIFGTKICSKNVLFFSYPSM